MPIPKPIDDEWEVVESQAFSVSPDWDNEETTQEDEWELVEPKPALTLRRLGGAVKEGAKDIVRQTAQFMAGAIENEPLVRRQNIQEYAKREGIPLEVPQETYQPSETAQKVVTTLREGPGSLKTSPEYQTSSGWIEDFVRAAPQMGAQIGSYLIGGPLASMSLMGAQIAGGTYENLTAQGVDPKRAISAGVANAIMQAPLEQIGVSKVAGLLNPRKIITSKLKAIGEAMGAEWLTEFLQAYPEMVTDVWGKGADDTKAEIWNSVVDQTWDATKQGAYEGTLTAPWALIGAGAGVKAKGLQQRPSETNQPVDILEPTETPQVQTVPPVMQEQEPIEELITPEAGAAPIDMLEPEPMAPVPQPQVQGLQWEPVTIQPEGGQYAEGIGTQTQKRGEPAQELVGGAEGQVRVRGLEKDRVEAERGEEVTPRRLGLQTVPEPLESTPAPPEPAVAETLPQEPAPTPAEVPEVVGENGREEAKAEFQRAWDKTYGSGPETETAKTTLSEKQKPVEEEPTLSRDEAQEFAKMTDEELAEYNASKKPPAWAVPGTMKVIDGLEVWQSKYKGWAVEGGNNESTPEKAASEFKRKIEGEAKAVEDRAEVDKRIEQVMSSPDLVSGDDATFITGSRSLTTTNAEKWVRRVANVPAKNAKKAVLSLVPVGDTSGGATLYSSRDVIQKAKDIGGNKPPTQTKEEKIAAIEDFFGHERKLTPEGRTRLEKQRAALKKGIGGLTGKDLATAKERLAQIEKVLGAKPSPPPAAKAEKPKAEGAPLHTHSGPGYTVTRIKDAEKDKNTLWTVEMDQQTRDDLPAIIGIAKDATKSERFPTIDEATGQREWQGVKSGRPEFMRHPRRKSDRGPGKSGASPADLEKAVKKALAGEPLGVKQARLVEDAIIYLHEMRLQEEAKDAGISQEEFDRIQEEEFRRAEREAIQAESRKTSPAEVSGPEGKGRTGDLFDTAEPEPWGLTPSEPTKQERLAMAPKEKGPKRQAVFPTEKVKTATTGKQEGLFGETTKPGKSRDLFAKKPETKLSTAQGPSLIWDLSDPESPAQVQALLDTADTIKSAVSILPAEVQARLEVKLKPKIDMQGRNIAKSLKEHGRKSVTSEDVLGTMTIEEGQALIEIAYRLDEDMETTALHETYHVARDWLLPKAEIEYLSQEFESEEKEAESFAKFAKGGKTRMVQPGIKGRVKEIFNRLYNALRQIRMAFQGKGFENHEDIWRNILGKRYEPHFGGEEVGTSLSAEQRLTEEAKTENFKRWFGNSVVTDNGKPRIFWHGTGKNPNEDTEGFDVPAFFAASKEGSREFGPNRIPAYLKIEKPLDLRTENVADTLREEGFSDLAEGMDALGYHEGRDFNIWDEIASDGPVTRRIKEAGYDGILYFDTSNQFEDEAAIVFSPTQIKSVFNLGTWSPTNPDIRMSVEDTPDSLASDLGITYDGEMEMWTKEGKVMKHQFTDPSIGGATFAVKDLSELPGKLEEKRREFGKGPEVKLSMREVDPIIREKFEVPEGTSVIRAIKGAFEPSKWTRDGAKAHIDRLRTLTIDKYHPLEQLGRTPYLLHRMLGNAHTTISTFLQHGKLSWNQGVLDVTTKDQGFLPWLHNLSDQSRDFFYWMAAKRAEKLEAEGRESWLDETARNKIYDSVFKGMDLAQRKADEEYFEKLNTEFQQWNRNVLDIAKQAGLLNQEQIDAFMKDYYLPFYRLMEDEQTREEFLKSPQKSKRHISAQIRRLKGGTEKIGDPIENILRNWFHLIQESQRNVARSSAAEVMVPHGLAEEVDKGELAKVLGSKTTKRWAIKRIGAKKVARTFDTEALARDAVKPGFEVMEQKTTSVMFGRKEDFNIISYQRNGETVYLRVADPDLFEALSEVNAKVFDSSILKVMSGAKRLLTAGATFSPTFRIANLLRDTLHTAVVSKSFIPFVDSVRGVVKVWKESPEYISLMASGGGFGKGWVESGDPKAMARSIEKILEREGKGKRGFILDTPRRLWDFWDQIGHTSEMAARVQLFKNLKQKGKTELEAAFNARDLLDFHLSGASNAIRVVNATVPFLNARVQGLDRLYRGAKDNPLAFFIKGALVSAASLMLWALWKDDDRYKELEDWDKWQYHHFWIGDYHFRVPKAFEVGAVFASLFESAANVLDGQEDWKYFRNFLAHTMTQTFAISPPAAFGPSIEVFANRSFFTGREIENMALRKLPPGERSKPWTPEILKDLGKATNVSPAKMEQILYGHTATFGTTFITLADAGYRAITDAPERPDSRVRDLPVVGRFMRHAEETGQTKYATRYFEFANEVEELAATVNNYKALGDIEEARHLVEENRDKLKYRKFIGKVDRALSMIRKEEKRVWADRDMTGEQKRQKLDDLQKQKNDLYQKAYDEVHGGKANE